MPGLMRRERGFQPNYFEKMNNSKKGEMTWNMKLVDDGLSTLYWPVLQRLSYHGRLLQQQGKRNPGATGIIYHTTAFE